MFWPNMAMLTSRTRNFFGTRFSAKRAGANTLTDTPCRVEEMEKSGPPPQYDMPPPAYPMPPQPPPAMAAPVPGPQPTVIPVYITARTSVYGPNPVEMDCPHCQAHIVSHIERVPGALPWLILGMCVVLGFFLFFVPWCFCCVPFCIDSCLDVVHSCPNCRRHLGRYNRM